MITKAIHKFLQKQITDGTDTALYGRRHSVFSTHTYNTRVPAQLKLMKSQLRVFGCRVNDNIHSHSNLRQNCCRCCSCNSEMKESAKDKIQHLIYNRGYKDNRMFRFESFRVRKLAAINALNFYITLCMAFMAHISVKSEVNALKVAIIQEADPIKEKVHFCYYRLAKGISGIPSTLP